MESGLYVALSGQLALQRRLDPVANNVANRGTPGFRAEIVNFESVLSRSAVAHTTLGKSRFSPQSGAMTQTGNPLDVAIQGSAHLSVSTPAGIAYTRDGRLRTSATGELESSDGHPVLDAGGAPVQINPTRGPVEIARNGTVSQNGERIGVIGLFRLPADARLTRGAAAGFATDKAAEPIVSFDTTGLVQGFIEGANVNPVLEMTRLISIQRSFEAMSAAMDQSDRKLSDAIRALSSGSR